jgi:hypothetical protein
VLTEGRAVHLVIGGCIPAVAYGVGGYNALGWAVVGTVLAACLWEIITPAMAGPMGWVHRYGDVIDLVAFLAGVVLSAAVLGRP